MVTFSFGELVCYIQVSFKGRHLVFVRALPMFTACAAENHVLLLGYEPQHATISLPQLHHEMNALFATKCVWEL